MHPSLAIAPSKAKPRKPALKYYGYRGAEGLTNLKCDSIKMANDQKRTCMTTNDRTLRLRLEDANKSRLGVCWIQFQDGIYLSDTKYRMVGFIIFFILNCHRYGSLMPV